MLRAFQVSTSGLSADSFDVGRSIFVDAAATPRVGDADAPGEGGEDVRILPVLMDGANERYRSVNDAVLDYWEEEFLDWPVSGVRSALFTCRALRRSERTFLQQHADWRRLSGIRENDRAVFEHETLSRALHQMMYYDQLVVPNIAAAETILKRRMLIEQAYKGRPDAPCYEGAVYFHGQGDAADGTIIDPANVKYTAERLHAESEVAKQSRLARAEKAARGKGGAQPNADDDDGGADLRPAQKKKGKAKGRRGGGAPTDGGRG